MKDIVHYWDLIVYKAKADLHAEARRYYISYLWWIIEPIFDMIVYYFVFSVFLQRGTPDFVPFLLIGLTSWKWFGATIQHGSQSIMQGKGLMLQVYLPKIVFPSIIILTDTFKFFIIFFILLVFLWAYGLVPNPAYVALPLVLFVELSLIVAVSFLCAAVTPFFPDLSIFIGHFLQLLLFLSGIFFNPRDFSPEIQFWLFMNPMATLIVSFRDILMSGNLPNFGSLYAMTGASLW
jgi:lipopolysaccharide transport system permease protein